MELGNLTRNLTPNLDRHNRCLKHTRGVDHIAGSGPSSTVEVKYSLVAAR